ncbi:MAG TPA: hypothetical protein VGM90_36200 [Kofleriaceae bacterium]|jgi:hypothetical protein
MTDDDFLTAPVPEPLADASPSERAHAKTFADIVDKAVSGRAPAAMSADDRALLEVATVIRATHGNAELAPEKRRSIVEDVLRQAVGGSRPAPSTLSSPMGVVRGRFAPWLVAGSSTLVAAAAMLVLWLRAPATAPTPQAPVAEAPMSWMSRPADPLFGPIAREQAGNASDRIDYLFADRLDGYRERRLSSGGAR